MGITLHYYERSLMDFQYYYNCLCKCQIHKCVGVVVVMLLLQLRVTLHHDMHDTHYATGRR